MDAERSFDEFFQSLVISVAVCTITVSLFKYLTDYYFFIIIGTLCITVVVLIIYRRYTNPVQVYHTTEIRRTSEVRRLNYAVYSLADDGPPQRKMSMFENFHPRTPIRMIGRVTRRNDSLVMQMRKEY